MKIRRLKKGVIGLNLTSMIDVVFLLLIYFMVATEFQTSEAAFPMDLPERNHGQSVLLDDEPLIVLVESVGESVDSIRIRLSGPWEDVGSVASLHQFLKKHIANGFGHHGLFSSTHPIVIRPQRTTRWDHVLIVYNAVATATYSNITLDEPLP